MERSNLDWHPLWDTGHHEIDAQHRALFQRMEGVARAVHEGREHEAIRATLGFLERYVVEHFQAEEALMQASAYPGLERHRQGHQELEGRTRAILTDMDANGPSATEAFIDLFADWLVKHIGSEDRAMAAHLRDQAARS